VSFRPSGSPLSIMEGARGVVRYIGMDVHREFAQLAVVEDGLVRDEGRIGVTPEALRSWAGDLRPDDQVALEATGNSDAIATLLTPVVARVVVSKPIQDPRDCGGEGQDRQDRRPDPRAAAGCGFSAAGVASR
jgi:hypothetical protein